MRNEFRVTVHLAKPGDFCQNQECPEYQKLQNASQQNIIKAGKTKAGVQRYECKTCRRPPFPMAGGGIDEAMIAVYGLTPEYGGRGRPPIHKKSGKDWLYLQMVKQHDKHGHFTGTKLKAIFGNLQELLKRLGDNLVKHHKSLRVPLDNLPGRKWKQRTPMLLA